MSRSMPRLGLLLLSTALAGAVLQLPNPAWATTDPPVYVAADGSGSVCSAAAPCSISGAQAKVRALIGGSGTGDVQVYVSGGTYSLSSPVTFGPSDSGTSTRNVIWQAATGATPLFTGAVPVTGWVSGSNGIWSAPVPAGITSTRQLYVNGVRATLARSDNEPNFATVNGSGVFTTPHTATSIASWKNIKDVEAIFHSTFITSICPVDSAVVTGSNDSVTMAQPCFDEAETDGVFSHHADQINFLQNAYELLDQPGEWYLDKSGAVAGTPRFYYKPKAGQNLTDSTVTVPGVEQLMTVSGTVAGDGTISRVHDLQFSGLKFADSTWQLPTLQHSEAARVDDATTGSGGVTYSGAGWVAQTGAGGQYNATQTFTQTNGNSFSFGFSGVGVDFISAMATNRGSFDYQIDGGAVQSGTCYSVNAVNQQPCLKVRDLGNGAHTITVTKTGGTYLSVDALRTYTASSTIDDGTTGSGAVTFTGPGWAHQTGVSGQYANTQTVTQTNGESFSYTFSGQAIDFISAQATNRGAFTYSVDGGAERDGSCYSDSAVNGSACLSVMGLGSGSHTITVTKTGGQYLSLDALRVSTAPVVTRSSPAYVMQQADMIITGNQTLCQVSDQTPTPAAVDIAYAQNIVFSGNTITRVGDSGLSVEKSSNNITVSGNHIFDASADGINVGGVSLQDQRPTNSADRMHDITLSNNYIHDVSWEFPGGVGILAGFVDTLKVLHNEIADVPYSGMSIGWGWGWMDQGANTNPSSGTICLSNAEYATHSTPTVAKNNTIDGNYIHDFMRLGMDGGAIYTLGSEPGSTITNNYVRNSPAGINEHSIYNDNGSAGWSVNHNVVDQTDGVYDAANGGNTFDSTTTWSTKPWPTGAQTVIDNAGLQTGFKQALHGYASTSNLALGQGVTATANSSASGSAPSNVIDDNATTVWTAGASSATLTLTFPIATMLNRVELQEHLQYGNNDAGLINSYSVAYLAPDGTTVATAASGSYPASNPTISFAQVTTTKVIVTIVGGTPAPMVSELGVFYDAGDNVALNQSATQSSTGYSGVPGRAVDGNTSGDWNAGSVTSTNNDANAWWQVDLGSTKSIWKINIWNRSDYGDRLSDYWVFVSTTPFTTMTPTARSQLAGVWSYHATSQAALPTAITANAVGRYVMVQLSGTNYLSLAEVQVMQGELP